MLFQTTAAHEELRAKIRSFAEEEIKPLAFLMDQNNEFPEESELRSVFQFCSPSRACVLLYRPL